MSHQVFISHSSKDKAMADMVCNALEAQNIPCWIAPRDIPFGKDWSEAIVEAIAISKTVVLVFSSASNASPQVRREVQRAFEKGVVVIPVRVEDVIPHPALDYYISGVHWLDAANGLEDHHLESLAQHIGQLLIADGTDAGAAPSAISPVASGATVETRSEPDRTAAASTTASASPPPAAESVPATHPHNLPQQLSSFIGRQREKEEIKQHLAQTRLLTITAAGGSGKTRISLQVAEEALTDYPDGVWQVELAPLSDPSRVHQAVASVFGVREKPGEPLLQTLVSHLKTRHLLLLLDNAEHLMTPTAQLAETLLHACPQLHILVTSREALSIAGENVYRLPVLSLPNPNHLPSLKTLAEYEAVKLFIARATETSANFTLTRANAHAIANICYRLDGIPLALELAAARVRSMPVEQIEERLDNCFRILTSGSRTALPRQQTLRALIGWSYDLLTENERLILDRLSIFMGGWALAAAETVCADDKVEEWEVLDLLTSLVDKSLVLYEENDREARYRMLETVRQYSREQLAATDDQEALAERHCRCYLTLAEQAEPELTGKQQSEWLQRLEKEHDNLRAALVWSRADPGRAIEALRLSGALWRFWSLRGYHSEGRQHLEAALAQSGPDIRTAEKAKALNGAGVLAWQQGDYPAARANYEACLAIRRELGDTAGIATSLNTLGLVAYDQGDYEQARQLYEESLALFRQVGDHWRTALTLNNLGDLTDNQGDPQTAQTLYEESLKVWRELGDKWGIALTLNNLGNVIQNQGDYARACALYEESLELCKELGDKRGIGLALNNLGDVMVKQNECVRARALFEESLLAWRELGDKRGIAESLHAWANLAVREEPARAARLYAAGEALREALGVPLPPEERRDYEQNIAAVRAALSEQAFCAEWEAGSALEMEEAVDYALEPVAV